MKCGSPKEGAVLAGRGAIATLLAVLLVAAPASASGERVAPSERVQAQLLPPSPQAHGAAHRRAIPRRPRDSAALRTAKQRGAFGAMGPSLPLAPTTTFGGLNQAGLAATDNTAANQGTPPDTTGAIGPNHYVEFVNSKIRVFNSSGLSAVSSADLDTFVGKSGDSVFDPQIQWDAQAGRWLYVADDVPNSGNFLVFGFSKTSDPGDLVNGWCRYSVSTGSDFNDYPKLGHNDNNMIFGANVFGPVSFKNAAVWTAPKPAVGSTTCPASVAATSFSLGSSVFTPVPANTTDVSANGYVVAASDPGSGTANHIGAWHVSGPASAPTVTSDGSMTVSSYSVPANLPQPGSTDVIDSSDARLTQAVARADPDAAGAEAVWTQHTVAGTGGRSVVRWYELLPASLTVRQQGTIQDASNFDFNGAISPSGTGNEAVINYNVGSAAQLVQIRAQSRTGSAALGTMSSETTLGTSAAIDQDFSCPSVDSSQPSCRWGDYAGASPDPNNNNVVWGSSQLNGPVSGSNAAWTTRNFALDPGDPTVVTGAASSVSKSTATIAGTVNPNGQTTTYHFDYGPTTGYGSSAPSPDASAGSGTSATAVSASLSGLTAGTTYHYRLAATNATGTSRGTDRTFTTVSAPAVSLTSPANGSSIKTGTPTFSGSAGTAAGDLATVTVNVYSGAAASGSPVETLTTTASGGAWSVPASPALSEGTYTAQAQQSDSAGNVGLSSANTFTVDTTLPVVSLAAPVNGSSTNAATPSFSGAAGTASGDSTTVTVKVYAGSSASGSPVQTLSTTRSGGSWSVSASSALAQGTYTAQAQQSDAAGNVGLSSPSTFTVDTTAPVLSLTAPSNGSSTTDTTPAFSGSAGTATGDSSTVTVKVYAGSSASGSPVQTLPTTRSGGSWSVTASPALSEGTYTARAEQTDAAGNLGLSSPSTFTVDTTAPVLSLSAPANGSTVNAATFSGAAGTASGDSSTVTVKVYSGPNASGTPLQTLNTTRSSSSWSVPASPPLADGQYTARAEQSDAAGNVGFSSASTFTVNTASDIPPNAVFTFSSPAFTGQPVAFDASGSNDPDGFVSSYSWDFGDGASGVGQTTSHTYATPGARTVTLTVTDNSGSTGMLAQQVSVTSPSAGSVSTQPPPTSGSSPPISGSQPSAASTTAPAVSASLFRQTLRTVLARGLVVYVGSDRIAKADVALVMDRRAARRIGITSASRDVVLGRVVKSVTPARRTRILVKLTRKAGAALKRVSKVTVVLTVKVTDAAGKATTTRRKLTLER